MHTSDNQHEAFDYVVVGAGSAGCALVARLTENSEIRVLLLEAGGDDRVFKNPSQWQTNVWVGIPAGVAKAMEDPRVNWGYESIVDEETARSHVLPRGKILGGSSAINGMIYARGHHEDYDQWRDEYGCTGWGWNDVAPVFRRMESNTRGEDPFHAASGPVTVSDVEPILPISRIAERACIEAGIPANDDIWGTSPEGVTRIQLTVKNGRRVSGSTAYLRPAESRNNLCVRTGALVENILFEGKRAVGIAYRHESQRRVVHARAEVILCAGTINSPMLLERSGVGDGEQLRGLGIETVHHSPEVGENLQEHYNASLQYELKPNILTFTQMSRGWGAAKTALKYLATRRGLMAGSVGQVVAYAKTDPTLERPDYKILFMLITASTQKVRGKHKLVIGAAPGVTLMTCQLRPESRGSTHIVNPEADAAPQINPNFLACETDREVTTKAVRAAVNIASQPALAECIARPLTLPEGNPDDAALYASALKTGHPGHHLSCSCRMGGDERSVVDPLLRVRGVEGLRVADCSIMPRLVSGNTNVPAMMIGERASDLISK